MNILLFHLTDIWVEMMERRDGAFLPHISIWIHKSSTPALTLGSGKQM